MLNLYPFADKKNALKVTNNVNSRKTLSNHSLFKVVAPLALLVLPCITHAELNDEVFLAKISAHAITEVTNISNRSGYDNQPHFTPDSKNLLFTSMYVRASKKQKSSQQTDSMNYHIASKKLSNLTNSAASEYSPTITLDGEHFSTIRVGDDGKQLLWKFPYTGKASYPELAGESLIPSVFDVGYHVWLNPNELLLFILGEPVQLQRVNLKTGEQHMVATDIGRTLRKVPNKNLYSYTKYHAEQWQLHLYNPEDKSAHASVILPAKNMYYAWHENGHLLSAENAQVMQIDISKKQPEWQAWNDFSPYCKGEITRMAMSNDGQYFAFVCSTQS